MRIFSGDCVLRVEPACFVGICPPFAEKRSGVVLLAAVLFTGFSMLLNSDLIGSVARARFLCAFRGSL